MNEHTAPHRRKIVVERKFPHPPEKIWRVLTQSDLISEWLMPNDFEPIKGHRFTFRTKPLGKWDGIVRCEVLECDPPLRLSYSWLGGVDDNGHFGDKLDSVVTWTLTPADQGTVLLMEHDGFGPGNQNAYKYMSTGGWDRIVERVGAMAGENRASGLG
jgi:uncharacterized protein YndB with AHSA1/START domain